MIRTRFAPSPTGFMHIGNLRTALYAYLFAKTQGKVHFKDRGYRQGKVCGRSGGRHLCDFEKAGIFHDEGPDVAEDTVRISKAKERIYIWNTL